MFGYIKKKDVLAKIQREIDFRHERYEHYTNEVMRLNASMTSDNMHDKLRTMLIYEQFAGQHSARESELRELYSAIERM